MYRDSGWIESQIIFMGWGIGAPEGLSQCVPAMIGVPGWLIQACPSVFAKRCLSEAAIQNLSQGGDKAMQTVRTSPSVFTRTLPLIQACPKCIYQEVPLRSSAPKSIPRGDEAMQPVLTDFPLGAEYVYLHPHLIIISLMTKTL